MATLTVKPFAARRTFHVRAGQTILAYDPAHPGAAVKTIRFTHASSAHTDAQVWVNWNVKPAPIPGGGPFLRIVDGSFAGLLIVQSQVTLT